MSIDRIQIERELRRINLSTNIDQIRDQADALIGNRLTSVTSRLGVQPGEVFGGFQALTSEIDDVVPQLNFSVPSQLVDRMGVAQMTSNVPQLANKLTTSVGASSSDLAAITETSNIDTSMINVVISGTTPQAIAAALGEVIPKSAAALGQATEVSVQEVKSVMEDIVDVNIPFNEAITQAETARARITSIADQFAEEVLPQLSFNSLDNVVTQSISKSNKIVNTSLNAFNRLTQTPLASLNNIKQSFSGILPNIIENLAGSTSSIVSQLSTVNGVALTVPPEILNRVRSLIQQNNFNSAATAMSSFSDLPIEDIADRLRQVDVSLSGNLNTSPTAESISASAIGTNETAWDEATTLPEAFSIIGTHEELEVELKSSTREITEVIVDWTRTHINQNLTAEDFQEINSALGFAVAHHYFIRRDGSLQRGRPINVLGPRLINNHNRYSILVAFVGGINVPSGVPNQEVDRYLSKDSLTTAQMNTFKVLMQKCYSAWPGVQALGLNEIDTSQVAPGFSVTDYVQDMFDKTSVYTDPANQQSYNRTTLITTPLPDYNYNYQGSR
jgi:hypothetical protein